MNWESFLAAFKGAAVTMGTSCTYKSFSAAVLAIIFHKHAVLCYGFSFLVFVDVFAKWAAISYQHLKTLGVEAPTFIQTLQGLNKARRAGEITSEKMKHRFLGKIAVYLICVIVAAVTDALMCGLEKPIWAVEVVVGYLIVTELLSIIENLNDAGVTAMSGLLAIVKKKV